MPTLRQEIRILAHDFETFFVLDDAVLDAMIQFRAEPDSDSDTGHSVYVDKVAIDYAQACATHHADVTPVRNSSFTARAIQLAAQSFGDSMERDRMYKRDAPAPGTTPDPDPSPQEPSQAVEDHNMDETAHDDLRELISRVQAGEQTDLANYYTKTQTYTRTETDQAIDDDVEAHDGATDNHSDIRQDISDIQTFENEFRLIVTALEDALPENFPTDEGDYVLRQPDSGRRTWVVAPEGTTPFDPAPLVARLNAIEADRWVTSNRLAFGAINSARFLDGKIVTDSHLVDNVINRNVLLANSVVETRNIGADQIERGHLQDNVVGTGELVDGEVTEGKLHADVRTKLNATRGLTAAQLRDLAANTAKVGITSAQATAIEANSASIADLERDFLAEPTYWVSGNNNARTYVIHTHEAAQPTGATRLRMTIGGGPQTVNLVAGDTDYSFTFTGTQAGNVNSNLRGATTVQATMQYLDSSSTALSTQNILLRVLSAAPSGVQLVRLANEAAYNAIAVKDSNTVYWWP